MLNVKEIARKNTVMSELMVNREKGNTEELIKASMKKGETFTIDEVELCTMMNEDNEEETVWAYSIKEMKDKFFFAGLILKKVFDAVVHECEGDYQMAYDEIKNAKLVVRYGQKKTRDGKRTVTTVDFV